MDQQSFLFQAMIFLGAAVIMVPIAKKLGLGSVLGYLIAGILIGPAILGFVGAEGKDLMHYAEFGVVLMLFIVGLELEPANFWKLRKLIVGLGGLQLLITTILIGGGAFAIGLPWQYALAIGMILSLSSTAIVLQSFSEKDQLRTPAGQSSFAVLLFQDIAVIPMLALLPLLAISSSFDTDADMVQNHSMVSGIAPGWQAVIIIAAVAVVIFGSKFLVKPLFRVVAATKLREIFTATALLLVIGIAVLMTQVGLSPALGTFVGGVVLATSEYKHELESDVEPFKGLLLGLFFMAVGASMDFELIFDQPGNIFLVVLGLMLVKALVLFILGWIFKIKIDQRFILAFALSQVGEFGFVLFSFAQQKAILPTEMINFLVAVVAISMALTPLLMLLFEKVIQPRLYKAAVHENSDADEFQESNPVIIAGFGHFGNTTGRFLRAHGIGMTILDHDAERVALLRKMGFKVYFGDASRYDLLHSAGADKAKLIIITIDPPEKRLEMIATIKKHFPQLRMLVRAQNRMDSYDLMNEGMLHVYRETLDTSLRVGVDAMKFLGFRAYSAQRAARTFMKIDEENVKKLASIKDFDEYIVSARDKIEELERILSQDIQTTANLDKGWDEETMIEDANKLSEDEK